MQDPVFYLVCPPLEPFPLPWAGIVRIGRSADCEVVLAHSAVSRLHAQLWWGGKRYELRDEGSLNGTFVNRRRVRQVELEPGDRIRVGPFTLRLAEGQLADMQPTMQWEDSTAGTVSKEASVAFSGRIDDMELNEVVQWIGMSGKSGRLEVQAENTGGELVFRDGDLIDAASGSLRGEAAVFELLRQDAGRFQFVQREVPSTRTIQRSTLHLLLEACRMLDEARV